MKEVFERAKSAWPTLIKHNSEKRNEDNSKRKERYEVGLERLSILQKHSRPFAYKKSDSQHWHLCFIFELEEGDQDYRMPENTWCEYVVIEFDGNEPAEIIAYYWRESRQHAVQTALNYRMNLIEEEKNENQT